MKRVTHVRGVYRGEEGGGGVGGWMDELWSACPTHTGGCD